MSIVYHMVSSLDGFVGDVNGDYSWMESSWDSFSKGVELTEEVVRTVLDSIDGYVMGSRTYELALKLGWPYGEKPVIVVTSREFSPVHASVEFYSGELKDLVKRWSQKTVWLAGGPTLAREFFRQDLVDEVLVSVVPVLLGNGVKLFSDSARKLNLQNVTAYQNGMIDLHYTVADRVISSGS